MNYVEQHVSKSSNIRVLPLGLCSMPPSGGFQRGEFFFSTKGTLWSLILRYSQILLQTLTDSRLHLFLLLTLRGKCLNISCVGKYKTFPEHFIHTSCNMHGYIIMVAIISPRNTLWVMSHAPSHSRRCRVGGSPHYSDNIPTSLSRLSINFSRLLTTLPDPGQIGP